MVNSCHRSSVLLDLKYLHLLQIKLTVLVVNKIYRMPIYLVLVIEYTSNFVDVCVCVFNVTIKTSCYY